MENPGQFWVEINISAFQSAEDAVGEFVKTGKLNFRDLVTSLIADLAKLAARRFILGPIANALSGALGAAGSATLNLGGSFNLPSTQASGAYTGTFNVTVAYN